MIPFHTASDRAFVLATRLFKPTLILALSRPCPPAQTQTCQRYLAILQTPAIRRVRTPRAPAMPLIHRSRPFRPVDLPRARLVSLRAGGWQDATSIPHRVYKVLTEVYEKRLHKVVLVFLLLVDFCSKGIALFRSEGIL